MPNLCNACAAEVHCNGDFKGIAEDEVWELGKAAMVMCDGCGIIQVDPEGNCVDSDCKKKGTKGHGMPWKRRAL